MDFTAILSKFAEHGVLGLVVLALYREWREERKGRLEDAARYSDTLLKVNDRVHETSEQMAKTADALIDVARGKGAGQ